MTMDADLKSFADQIKPAFQTAMHETGHFGVAVKRTLATVGKPAWHFTEGATSYPTNVFAGLVQLAALTGSLGEQMRYAAHFRQAVIDKLVLFVKHHPVDAAELFWYYAKNHLIVMAGSWVGTNVWNQWLFKRIPLLNQESKWQKIVLRFSLKNLGRYGAANLAISYGVLDLEHLIGVLVTSTPLLFKGSPSKSSLQQTHLTQAEITECLDVTSAIGNINHAHL